MSVVRYAPSPTGHLHLGNARPALLNWLFALKTGGRYILRLDDTDRARSNEAYAQAIVEDLAWLGITPERIFRQSDRTALYDLARDRLLAAGRLYPCYETEDELDAKRARARLLGRPPIYDRAALAVSAAQRAAFEAEGRRPHYRFRLTGEPVGFDDRIKGPQTVNTASLSDPVLIRADGSYLYTLPSVVDDIDMGITHVIRGEDHVSNTGPQIELFAALGAKVPGFAHHNLLTGADGEGFSKRLGSLSLRQLRDEGYEAMAVAVMAALTGSSVAIEPYSSLAEMAEHLDFSAISHGAARFDTVELLSLNARLVHALPYVAAASRLPAGIGARAWELLRGNIGKLPEVAPWARILAEDFVPPVPDEADRALLALARELLPPEPWDETTAGAWTASIKLGSGRKGRALFMPLRLALSGREDGPDFMTLLALLGRKACLARLS